MNIITKEHDGTWFTRIWLDESNQLICQYEVLEIFGWEGGGKVPAFRKKNTDFNDHETTTDHGPRRRARHDSRLDQVGWVLP